MPLSTSEHVADAGLATSAEGDESGLRTLLERFGPMVHAICQRRLGPCQDADDASQATFLALAKAPRRLRDGRAVGAWLHRVAVRACAQQARSRSRRRRHEAAAAALMPRETSWETDLEEETAKVRAVLDDALADLPTTQRAAIIERFFAGRDYAGVGATLGISADAAKKRVAAALAQLRRALLLRGVSRAEALLMPCLDHEGQEAARHAADALAVLRRPASPAAFHLHEVLRSMLLLRSLLLPTTLLLPLVLLGAVAVHAADSAPTPPPAVSPAPAPVRYPKFYDLRDLIDGQQLWSTTDLPSTDAVPPGPPADHGPAAACLAHVRTSAAAMAQIRAALGGTDPAAQCSVVYPGMPRGDLIEALAGHADPTFIQGARDVIASTTELVPGIIGASDLVVVSTSAGHRRLDALLRGARDLLLQARRPWQDAVAKQLDGLMQRLRAGAHGTTWAPVRMPRELGTADGARRRLMQVVFLPEVPPGAGMLPILIAGAPDSGTFLLLADGTRVWCPDDDVFQWAQHVRQVVDAGLVQGPLTREALRQAGATPLPVSPTPVRPQAAL